MSKTAYLYITDQISETPGPPMAPKLQVPSAHPTPHTNGISIQSAVFFQNSPSLPTDGPTERTRNQQAVYAICATRSNNMKYVYSLPVVQPFIANPANNAGKGTSPFKPFAQFHSSISHPNSFPYNTGFRGALLQRVCIYPGRQMTFCV